MTRVEIEAKQNNETHDHNLRGRSVCFLCTSSVSEKSSRGYNFLSVVSPNHTVRDTFLRIIQDIKADTLLKDTEFSQYLESPEYCRILSICALCFKRFCDYETFSNELFNLKCIFERGIKEKLGLIDKKFICLKSEYNNLQTGINNETRSNQNDEFKLRSSSRKRKKPPRFSLNDDGETTGETVLNTGDITQCDPKYDNLEINNILSSENATTKYICTDCGKIFWDSKHLEAHERIHRGQKPFPCEVCGKSFTRKASMLEHVARHQGMFKCSLGYYRIK